MGRLSVIQIAHHEAGHAVAAVVLGIGIEKVTLEDDEEANALAYCLHPGIHGFVSTTRKEQAALARDLVYVCYAGYAAEARYQPKARRRQAAHDDANASELCWTYSIGPRNCFVGDEVYLAGLKRLENEAKRLVRKCWPSIHAVAIELKKRRTLTCEEVRTIIRREQPGLLDEE